MQVVPKPSGVSPDGYQKQINLDLFYVKYLQVLITHDIISKSL